MVVNKMMVAYTSDSTQFTTVCIGKISGSDNEEGSDSEEEEGFETIQEDFSIENWVVVNYNGEEFLGEITSCGTEIEVSVIHKSGNKFWKWPKTIDKFFFRKERMLYEKITLQKLQDTVDNGFLKTNYLYFV